VHRLVDEASRKPVVTNAVGRANAARERVETISRNVLTQLGIAPAGDVEKLRKEIARLERRLKKLEGDKKASSKREPEA
jgi:hypothetical protein